MNDFLSKHPFIAFISLNLICVSVVKITDMILVVINKSIDKGNKTSESDGTKKNSDNTVNKISTKEKKDKAPSKKNPTKTDNH